MLPICLRNRNNLIGHFDAAAFYFIDFADRDHEGFVDAADESCGDQFFEFREGLQGHDAFVERVDAAVVAHAFNVYDVVDVDFL